MNKAPDTQTGSEGPQDATMRIERKRETARVVRTDELEGLRPPAGYTQAALKGADGNLYPLVSAPHEGEVTPEDVGKLAAMLADQARDLARLGDAVTHLTTIAENLATRLVAVENTPAPAPVENWWLTLRSKTLWLTVIGAVVAVWGAVAGFVNPDIAAPVGAALVALYVFLQKQQDTKTRIEAMRAPRVVAPVVYAPATSFTHDDPRGENLRRLAAASAPPMYVATGTVPL